ncbi:DUF5362 family protein [Bacillus inaquosorum]|uniref:DUF5362 domain-containing protein n=1 Tax=Bacillus inaquosorum TaxID=483913 RepID=A0A9Q4EX95_9BACI|nr:DUF5362 family protein [Bacillus inaquosorum]MCY7786552.1 DUF5362 domain-containing protein [Bacillus inaquosorum]MCY7821711.1 DUF5362 domain-containing protein [Bacillus inaquosorum]MCY7940414.1 DUF5362 domain-containing protein [Bacillus inaquosorum]MCY7973765.1 DUF5362 domain-containing protein [Bacillus inaquosorum]MCY8084231.1 DUF5362 domain-containing protein [Bacillus inaquosorum]
MISLDKDENEIEHHNEESSAAEQEIVPAESESRQLSASAVKSLSDIAKWGKISGILLIIMGSLLTLSALMTVIGAIPGILLIISGVFLMRSAKAAAEAEGNLTGTAGESMLENYGKFIKMQLFYAASSIVTGLIGIILVIFMLVIIGIAAFENTNTYEDPDSYYYEDDPVFE